MAATTLGGVVLVGGRSRRMGRSKARILVGGTPLWMRQLRVLRAAGARPVLLALRAGQHSLGQRRLEIRDRAAGAGPIAGLHAALSESAAEWLAVLAVDMPHVDAAWFRRLRRLCRPGIGAVVAQPGGYEPLAAIYPRAALGTIARRMRLGRNALQGLVAELVRERRMVELRLSGPQRWRAANWNTPAEMRRGGEASAR